MVEIYGNAQFLFDGFLQQKSHLGELGEDECLFALLLDGGEQVQEHLELAGGENLAWILRTGVLRMTIFSIISLVSRLSSLV